jgi:transposase-like protein
MKKQTENEKATHRQHAPEYRAEALALAENVGVSQAANELGLHESQMYGWSFRLAFLAHKADEFSLMLRTGVRRFGKFPFQAHQ